MGGIIIKNRVRCLHKSPKQLVLCAITIVPSISPFIFIFHAIIDQKAEIRLFSLSKQSSMDSTLSVTAIRLANSKVLNSNCNPLIYHFHRRFYHARVSQLSLLRLTRSLTASTRGVNGFGSISSSRSLGSVVLRPLHRRSGCASVSASSFASGGGAFGGGDGNNASGGGGGGGGDGAAEGGEAKPNAVSGEANDVSALSSDVIVLDVGVSSCLSYGLLTF